MINNNHTPIDKQEELNCNYCKKNFSIHSSLIRHLNICKKKLDIEKDNNMSNYILELKEAREEINLLKQQILQIQSNFEKEKIDLIIQNRLLQQEIEFNKKQFDLACENICLSTKAELSSVISEQKHELIIQNRLLQQELEFDKKQVNIMCENKILAKEVILANTNCVEKVEFMKAFLPKNLKLKSNLSSEDNDVEDEKDSTSNVTNINGHNVYVTQNQFFIEKINNLPPINDVLENIVNDETLYDKLTQDFENFPKFISTEIAKCVLVKNFKKLLGVYRMKDENNEIKTLVDPIEKISKDFYNNPIFSQKIEEIYNEYDRNTPTGDDTSLLELNNSINLFRLLLNPEIVTNKNKEQLIKTSQDVILKQAKSLRN